MRGRQLEAVAFGSAGREREHGIEPVERLNRGLLVEAKDRRVLRRIEVQPDDVGRFRFKRRIGRPHVAVQPMRLEAGALPCPLHERMATQLQGLGEFAGTPMRRAIGRGLARPRENSRFEPWRQDGWRVAPISPLETGHARLEEPPLPFADGPRTLPEATLDVEVRGAVRQPQI